MVELRVAALGDALEGGRELRLAEDLAGLHRAEPGVEIGHADERPLAFLDVADQLRGDQEALAGVADGRGQDLGPGQLAEPPVSHGHAAHRARNADRQIADKATRRDRLALGVEIHARRGGGRSGLAIVEEVGFAVHDKRHEPTAAQVAGLRIGHGQGEGRRHGGVHRVAAALKDLLGRQGAIAVGRGDGAGGQGAGRRGVGLLRRKGRRGREAEDRREDEPDPGEQMQAQPPHGVGWRLEHSGGLSSWTSELRAELERMRKRDASGASEPKICHLGQGPKGRRSGIAGSAEFARRSRIGALRACPG